MHEHNLYVRVMLALGLGLGLGHGQLLLLWPRRRSSPYHMGRPRC